MLSRMVELMPLDVAMLRERNGSRHRALDRQLAWSLAFVAGAINAGGFLAVQVYTSHMTGPVSRAADEFALGHPGAAFAALGMVLCFLGGAFTTGLLVHVGRVLRLRSRHAISLALEAGLLLIFGLFGSRLELHRELVLPATVILLCFLMGMHNAVVTQISNAVVRTTHMTGILTDIGVGLSAWFAERGAAARTLEARARRSRLQLHALILVSFFGGGVAGAIGFKHLGYSVTLVFAAILIVLALRPIWLDIGLRRRGGRMTRARQRAVARAEAGASKVLPH
jgi:uncharacterized membrane protein YoaK (UPF0700 family)